MTPCKITAITNQKGDGGKTTTTVNLGVGLAAETSIAGQNRFPYDRGCKITATYTELTKEVLNHERSQSVRSRIENRIR